MLLFCSECLPSHHLLCKPNTLGWGTRLNSFLPWGLSWPSFLFLFIWIHTSFYSPENKSYCSPRISHSHICSHQKHRPGLGFCHSCLPSTMLSGTACSAFMDLIRKAVHSSSPRDHAFPDLTPNPGLSGDAEPGHRSVSTLLFVAIIPFPSPTSCLLATLQDLSNWHLPQKGLPDCSKSDTSSPNSLILFFMGQAPLWRVHSLFMCINK